MIEEFVQNLAHNLGAWAYLLVGAIAFLETAFFIGLFAPGEFTITLGGVLAGEGTVDLTVMIGIVWACAFAGDTTSFYLGRRLGRDFILRHGPRFRINEKRLQYVDSFFARHGGKTILIGRFIGLLRALAPFTAGASRMGYRAFLPYDILGTGIWSATFVLLGFFFWRSFEQVVAIAGQGTLVFGAIVFLIVAIVVVKRQLKDPVKKERFEAFLHRLGKRPPFKQMARVITPIWGFFKPHLKFLLERFTPGGLGLEMTTLLAALAVGIYVLVLYLALLASNIGPTPGDIQAATIAKSLRAGWHTDLIELVTVLGSPYVVVPVTVAVALVVAWRRYLIEAVVLVSGLGLSWLSVYLIKNAVERPRPAGSLIDVTGFSFPSTHATMTVAYVAIAIIVVRTGLGRWSGTALMTAAVLVAAAVGLTRLYLNVHYLSDITTGWAVGVAAFSICGIVGLMIGHARRGAE